MEDKVNRVRGLHFIILAEGRHSRRPLLKPFCFLENGSLVVKNRTKAPSSPWLKKSQHALLHKHTKPGLGFD